VVRLVDVSKQPRINLRTTDKCFKPRRAGPTTVLCELEGLRAEPGCFAVSLRGAQNCPIAPLAELRPIFNCNQVYVTFDLVPSLFNSSAEELKSAMVLAGTVVGSCAVVQCKALYPLYLRSQPVVDLSAVKSVKVPPNRRKIVRMEMANGWECRDSFPIIEVEPIEQLIPGLVVYRTQPPAPYWLDETRTVAGVEMIVENRTKLDILVEKRSKFRGRVCMYDTTSLKSETNAAPSALKPDVKVEVKIQPKTEVKHQPKEEYVEEYVEEGIFPLGLSSASSLSVTTDSSRISDNNLKESSNSIPNGEACSLLPAVKKAETAHVDNDCKESKATATLVTILPGACKPPVVSVPRTSDPSAMSTTPVFALSTQSEHSTALPMAENTFENNKNDRILKSSTLDSPALDPGKKSAEVRGSQSSTSMPVPQDGTSIAEDGIELDPVEFEALPLAAGCVKPASTAKFLFRFPAEVAEQCVGEQFTVHVPLAQELSTPSLQVTYSFRQCFGSESAWIRIKMPTLDPDLH